MIEPFTLEWKYDVTSFAFMTAALNGATLGGKQKIPVRRGFVSASAFDRNMRFSVCAIQKKKITNVPSESSEVPMSSLETFLFVLALSATIALHFFRSIPTCRVDSSSAETVAFASKSSASVAIFEFNEICCGSRVGSK